MGINEKLDLVELELFKSRIENEKLKEALSFYANSKTYSVEVTSQWVQTSDIDWDLGAKARKILGEYE